MSYTEEFLGDRKKEQQLVSTGNIHYFQGEKNCRYNMLTNLFDFKPNVSILGLMVNGIYCMLSIFANNVGFTLFLVSYRNVLPSFITFVITIRIR